MVFMASGGELHEAGNASHWLDQKHPSFYRQSCSDNNKWETEAMCMCMDEEATRKEIGRFNTPIKLWGFTNYPKYHVDRFHLYRNQPKKMDLDIAECTNK